VQRFKWLLVGDVALAANFEGEVDGQAVTLFRTLDSAKYDRSNIVTQSDTPVPIVGSITQKPDPGHAGHGIRE
jgi:hypothetical protein